MTDPDEHPWPSTARFLKSTLTCSQDQSEVEAAWEKPFKRTRDEAAGRFRASKHQAFV